MRTLPGIAPADIYLPADHVDPMKWAVVACDQYTSQNDYWENAEKIVGDSPSTLRIIQPEIYLSSAEARIPLIRKAMKEYLETGAIEKKVENGFVLTERTTESGVRLGLIASVDLDQYDFTPGANALIRATEGTIVERIPPRVKIREGASIESPHVMILIDDKDMLLIEKVYEAVLQTEPLYDFDLMLGGGHLRGWKVTKAAEEIIENAVYALYSRADGFLYAVGDGNHSLATAKACWENIKKTLTPEEIEAHPAKYALTELVNLHSPALIFEPIHRVLFGADANSLIEAFKAYLSEKGMALSSGNDFVFVSEQGDQSYSLSPDTGALPVAVLQPFLDQYLSSHPEISIDYVHGDKAVRALAQNGNTGILIGTIDKSLLFPSIRSGGVLPRKTFSMGEAHEKRYYMEARKIL
ncbi:MAG: DUF1015 domain-containing protein [Clostridia bacterium]|nr:DUF1015 domain-containing protein [Clostridia bacterium]